MHGKGKNGTVNRVVPSGLVCSVYLFSLPHHSVSCSVCPVKVQLWKERKLELLSVGWYLPVHRHRETNAGSVLYSRIHILSVLISVLLGQVRHWK